LSIGIVFIAIQLFRPSLNKNYRVLDIDISKLVATSDSVISILKNACYDCHSNNTDYPWYSNIQPTGWLMAYHIKKAKNELNFSEFGAYSQRQQLSKLDGIANSIKDDIMPLKSYKIMHKPAQLSTSEKSLLVNWAQRSRDSLSIRK
jgi:Haem-binding domain